jgi:hypothetical protein
MTEMINDCRRSCCYLCPNYLSELIGLFVVTGGPQTVFNTLLLRCLFPDNASTVSETTNTMSAFCQDSTLLIVNLVM